MLILVILVMLCTSIPADTLLLNSGKKLDCTTLIEKISYTNRLFLCNSDTIYPSEIRAKINPTGYFIFVDNTFLKRTISGKLSFYTGVKEEIVMEDIGYGFGPPILVHKKKESNKTYYTLDSTSFTEYKLFGRNIQLVNEIKKNSLAYSFYKGYRITQLLSIFSVFTFIIPVIKGLSKHGINTKLTPYAVISFSGITVFTTFHVIVPKKLFKKAIDSYNTM